MFFTRGKRSFQVGDKVRPVQIPAMALDTKHQIGAEGVLFVSFVEYRAGKQVLSFHDLEGKYPAFLFTPAN